MECLFFIGAIAFGVAIGLIALAFSKLRPAQAEEGLRAVAKRFGGSFFGRNWWRGSSVAFRYGAAGSLLRVLRGRGKMWLELNLHAGNPGYRLEIYPDGDDSLRSFDFDRSLKAWQTIERGQLRYLACAESPQEIEQFLTDGVRVQLDTLLAMSPDSSLTIVVESNHTTIRKAWSNEFRSSDFLLDFVYAALRLYDHIQLSRAEGINFVDPTHTENVEHEKCAICGEAIGGAYVTCRQCQAPHHTDCWQYNGSCGMYACRSLKCEPARKPMRTRPR